MKTFLVSLLCLLCVAAEGASFSLTGKVLQRPPMISLDRSTWELGQATLGGRYQYYYSDFVMTLTSPDTLGASKIVRLIITASGNNWNGVNSIYMWIMPAGTFIVNMSTNGTPYTVGTTFISSAQGVKTNLRIALADYTTKLGKANAYLTFTAIYQG